MHHFLWQLTTNNSNILSILLLPLLQLIIPTFYTWWSWSTCSLCLVILLIHTFCPFDITLLIIILIYSLNLLLLSIFLSPGISYWWSRSIPPIPLFLLFIFFLFSFPWFLFQSLNLFLHFPWLFHPFLLFFFIILYQHLLPLLHSSSILL